MYRRVAARCNYLALDRPDLQYSVKECCREMSKPTTGSWRRLVRIGRYLRNRPRAVWKYNLQTKQDTLKVYTDSNWAGCRRSGGRWGRQCGGSSLGSSSPTPRWRAARANEWPTAVSRSSFAHLSAFCASCARQRFAKHISHLLSFIGRLISHTQSALKTPLIARRGRGRSASSHTPQTSPQTPPRASAAPTLSPDPPPAELRKEGRWP